MGEVTECNAADRDEFWHGEQEGQQGRVTDAVSRAIVASRIREAREWIGLTQQEVSGALGVPRTSVHAMEAGKRGVSALELRRLARLYRRPVAWLLGEEADDPAATDGVLPYLASLGLSDEDKKQVLRFAEFIAGGASDRDEFWQGTPQGVTGATETSEQAEKVTRVTLIPDGMAWDDLNRLTFAVTVEWCGPFDGRRGGGYAIRHIGGELSKSGKWEVAPPRFRRWQFRWEHLDSALHMARAVVNELEVNGRTWADLRAYLAADKNEQEGKT